MKTSACLKPASYEQLGVGFRIVFFFVLLCGCRAEGPEQPAATGPAKDDGALASASQPSVRSAELPGLHNVLEVSRDFWSGSSPEGAEGFESLKQLGVKTIISVDGVRPELDEARRHGIRYVHIPVGYDGIPEEKQRRLARAIRDLPGPVYPGLFTASPCFTTSLRVKLRLCKRLTQNKEVVYVGTGCPADWF